MRPCSRVIIRLCLGLSLCAGLGCSSGDSGPRPATAGGRLDLDTSSTRAIEAFKGNDRAKSFFDSAYAWAVFPTISKGAVGLGIADGRGQVYQGGALVGWAKLTSVTVGPQIGGQSFSEIIFFRNQFAFDQFKAGGLKAQAGSGAVSGKQGGTNLADYSDGVAIFTLNHDGLIVSADVGAQSIHFASVN